MPAVSAAQEKLMLAVAHNPEFAKKVGIPQEVGEEFTDDEDARGYITSAGVLVEKSISPNMSLTKEGYLLCENAVIARTGIQEYSPQEAGMPGGADGKVRLIRSNDEVFDPKTLASFENKPITMSHPPSMLTSKNWGRFAKGSVHNIRQDGSLMRADLLITDSDTIKKVQDEGLRELSCGYYSMLDTMEPGVASQTSIIGNHVSIVTNARAGSICAIADSTDTSLINTENSKDTKMAKHKTSFRLALKNFIGLADEATKLAEQMDEDENEKGDTPADINDAADVAHEAAEDKQEADALTLIKELAARIEALEALNKQEESVTDEDGSEDDTAEAEVTDEKADAEDEETADGEYAVGDSINTIISKVEILAPGAKLMTSLGDSKDVHINISHVKKQALGQVALTDSDMLTGLLDGKSVDELSGDVLNVVFNAAVALKKAKNNSIVQQPVFLADSTKEKYDPLAAATARYYASR